MVALTRDLVLQFAGEQSWTERAKIVERVATRFAAGALAPQERQAALELFRLALYDCEPLVRRVLAESIKLARDLPRDIVDAIVHDHPDVSAPFLAVSSLIEEEDLVAIATHGAWVQRSAIAGRHNLSQKVLMLLMEQSAVG